MNYFNHSINSRRLTTVSPIVKELELDPSKNYLFDLSYLGCLSVEGDKGVEFLQGQLTADMTKVNDIQMTQSAQCNLKGRILAFMDVIQWNGLKLIMPKDYLEPTKNSLSKTALLSRVLLKEEMEYSFLGFYLQNPNDLIPQSIYLPDNLYAKAEGSDFCYYHLGAGFYIFVINRKNLSSFVRPFDQHKQLLGSLTWHTLRLMKKELALYPETRGQFLPHRLDLQNTPYISFGKGCYKGQEIIARTHYKATLKHELKLFRIKTQEALYSGQKVFNAVENFEVGELIDYATLGNDYYLVALSILKSTSLEIQLEKHLNKIMLEQYI